MIIRAATEADIVKASRLWLAMSREMRPEDTPNVEWWRKISTEAMRKGNYFLVVADQGGTIVGFADWFLLPDPSTGKIHSVGRHQYLHPEYRRKGIGREMYEFVIKDATRRGACAMEIFCFDQEVLYWEAKGFTRTQNVLKKEL